MATAIHQMCPNVSFSDWAKEVRRQIVLSRSKQQRCQPYSINPFTVKSSVGVLPGNNDKAGARYFTDGGRDADEGSKQALAMHAGLIHNDDAQTKTIARQ
ncbi:hypothetical protein BH10PLA2_BH10PLA2_11180 [soil metagenome]